MQVFYYLFIMKRVYIYVYCLWRSSYQEVRVWDRLRLSQARAWVSYVIYRFIDIGGIAHHHHLNFLFIIYFVVIVDPFIHFSKIQNIHAHINSAPYHACSIITV